MDDVMWFLPNGLEMPEDSWNHDFAKSLGVYFNGNGIRCVDYNGNRIKDDSFYIIFNAHHESLQYSLPSEKCGDGWKKIIDTSNGFIGEEDEIFEPGSSIQVQSRSVMVLRCPIN